MSDHFTPPDLADAAAAFLAEYDPDGVPVSAETEDRLRTALGDFLADEDA
jgi:hypothetical protein